MKCFIKTETVLPWQNRLRHIRDAMTTLACEDCDLSERHLIYRVALHQIEERQQRVQECRQQLRAEISAIEVELGLCRIFGDAGL